MGASTYKVTAVAKDAKTAFDALVTDARVRYGNGGYTGTIAEKRSFTMITCPPKTDVNAFINKLIDDADHRIDNKWGPSGCIDLGADTTQKGMRSYVFFGWASD